MSLFASILNWSRRRPDWQRDALRRLVGGGPLGDDEILELARMCLARHGFSEFLAPAAAPLGPADLPVRDDSSPRVVLTRVGDVANVNALAPAQELDFRPVGLTVVYGENGSGKSGYARVLKSACRARGTWEGVLGNVRERCMETPSAAIGYCVGEESRVHAWRAGTGAPSELAEINVFDARTAPAFVEGKTDLAWRPSGLALLDALATTCERVRAVLREEQLRREASIPPLPAAPRDSDVGRFLARVSEQTRVEDVRAFATLSPGEAAELEELERILCETSAAKRRDLETRLQRVRSLDDRLSHVEMVLDDEALAQLRETCDRKAEGAGRAETGDDKPREICMADTHAGPRDAPRCPTCGQTLPEGAARGPVQAPGLRDERFMNAESRRHAMAQAALRDVRILNLADRRDGPALEALGDARVGAWMVLAAARRAWVLEAARLEDWTSTPPPLPRRPELYAAILAMEEELDRLGSEAWIEDRWYLEQRRDQLRMRQALACQVEDVMARVAWMEAKRRLGSALQETDAAPINKARVSLAREGATDALRRAFALEIGRLDLAHLGVTVEPARASQGKAYNQMRLHSPIGVDVAPARVVSEGEHRCLALAGFLAELTALRNRSGIVFDDPVSSLDRTRQGLVASRLAAESAERQVIVFTHDLDFARRLRFEAERLGVPLATLHMRRDGGRPGFVEPGLPGGTPDMSLAYAMSR